MKKMILFYKLMVLVFISSISFSSIRVSKSEDLSLKTKKLESQIKKIKQIAKIQNNIQRLTKDPFKDFDYTRPNFYNYQSVK